MMKRTFVGIILMLLLTGMLMLAFNIQPVKASGTIYIRADGSIDPPTAPIYTADKVTYTFTGDINDSIIVERDNIIIDGLEHLLQGSGFDDGIYLSGRTNVTVKNLSIMNFTYGIRLVNSTNCLITGNNIKANNNVGVSLTNSSNSTVSRNNITNNFYGITGFGGSSNNSIFGNNVIDNWYGIYLRYSSNNNNISGNTIIANTWIGLYLGWCSQNALFGNDITNSDDGIFLAHSLNNAISENKIANNDRYGVHLANSSDNRFYHNNFIDNTQQVYDCSWDWPLSVNVWDDGYPSGGNYWSDYAGVDVKSGPNQDLPGSDGIGDTPHVIDAYSQDRYPFMSILGDVEPPVADADSNQSVFQGMTVTFDASRSTDDIAIKSYIWTFTDGTLKTLTGIQPQYTFKNAGDFEVTLNVTDYTGKWDIDTVWVYVLPDTTKPSIGTVHQEPEVPDKSEKVIVSVNVTDEGSGVHNVTLLYSTNEGVTWTKVLMNKTTGNTYEGEIPGLPAGTNVEYKIIAYDKAENFAVEDKAGQHYVYLVPPVQVGVEAGDWIKITYTITGWPAGQPYPEWLKVEFLSVEGTSATVRVTMHMSDGTEQNATVPVDVVAGGQAFGLSGFVIPANLTTGDIIFMSGYGNVTIAGETTRTYAGASRTVVYASISQYGTQLTYYWDKQTGVLVEASGTSDGMTLTAKATETNMWQAAPSGLPIEPIYLYILVALAIIVAVGTAAFLVRRKKKPPEEAKSPQI
jgi:parallel beta-helix repeat protein